MARSKRELLAEYFVEFARRGGKARAKKLTAERRREIARQGARAKWAKVKRAVTAVALALLLSEELVKYVWHHPEVEHIEAALPAVLPPTLALTPGTAALQLSPAAPTLG